MNLAVICDFDDTVAEQNVAELLLERFGSDGWRESRRSFRQGLLTLKEYQEKAFATVHQPKTNLQAFVQANASPRRSFPELAKYCQEHSVPLVITSNGLDFYVEAFLAKLGLEKTVPYHTVATAFGSDGKILFSYAQGLDGCYQWSQCKCSVLEAYKRQGYHVVFVGDGASDTCPAQRANHVVALRQLLEFCKLHKVPHTELTDFDDVIELLKQRSAP